jgi:Tol biopolymer transport system component
MWITPLSGGDPVLLEVDVSVGGWFFVYDASPTGDRLAFVVYREGRTTDLYVVPVSLRDARTTGPAVRIFEGWNPGGSSGLIHQKASWSPDGTRLAVVHGQGIWIAFSNGDKPVPLVQGIGAVYPDWSPDGEMVAYMGWPKQNPQGGLYVVSSHGGDPAKIEAGNYGVWSPDSKRLAVVSKDGDSISIVTVTEGHTREIVNVKDLGLYRFGELDWSPDGKYIACTGEVKGQPSAIFLIPMEGGKPTVLATDDDSWKQWLRWSPDGKWISYRAHVTVKVRAESALWEADFGEIVKSASR